jgi:hypothetical protein
MRQLTFRTAGGLTSVWFQIWEWYYTALETILERFNRQDAR